MTGVIDPDEVVDSGSARRIELAGVKLALIGGYWCKRVAHIADPRLLEVDQFNSWNCCENLDGTFGYAGYTGMLVQRNSLLDRMNEVWPEHINPGRNVRHHMFETECSIGARHHNLAQLDVASRAPRKDAGSARARESGDGISTHLPRRSGIAGTILN